jgi:uncharacterized protein YbjT (DUF2867 family)
MMERVYLNLKETEMILVIGGTGKVGSELLKQLSQKGIKARVLVRSAQKAETVKKLGHETVEGDYTKPSSFEGALSGVNELFLLTTSTNPDRWAADEIAVIDSAKKHGVKKIVLLSVLGASPDSPIRVVREHAKVEDYLKKSGLAYTILQPTGFIQNLLGQAATIKQGAIYGNYKEGRMGFIDARDIASVALAALTDPGHDGHTYALTGGEAVSYPEIAAKLTHLTGKTVNYVDVPTDAVVKNMVGVGFPEWLAKDLSQYGEAVAAGHTTATTDVVEKVAKKKPITVDEFLRDYAAAFKG